VVFGPNLPTEKELGLAQTSEFLENEILSNDFAETQQINESL